MTESPEEMPHRPELSQLDRMQLTAGLDFGAQARMSRQSAWQAKRGLALLAAGVFFLLLVLSPELPGLMRWLAGCLAGACGG